MLKKLTILKTASAAMALVVLLVGVPISAAAKGEANSAKAKFSDPYIGQMQNVTAGYQDTLVHIGREYGVGFVEMRAANPMLDPWIPGAGANIIIPTMNILPDAPHEGVVINLAEMRLYYYKTPFVAPITFPIGIGRDGLRTPVGTTTVVRKKDGPTWTPTDRMRKEDPTLPVSVPPGSENPMGTHALYLGFPTIAIHGTNKPYGIGRRVSSGCIRMFPEDITQMFAMVPVGTKVTVVDQPIKSAWIGNSLYLEVHPTQEQATLMEREGAIPDYQLSEKDLSYIMRVAGPSVESLDWPKIRKVVKERKGYPIKIAEKADIKKAER
ncbi:MAG: L,D-transpeptidase family protein [Alphaproteobacteria bacterium]|jgi:L,D-transpeptidase ErfK/SrfK|nr:L,D-transpeptidase family protein [Alphaproteobacteria bacterium]MCB1550966.1 L,D-transpeptidase family protein [Alphaproteobacteria bacterium]MCB9984142.1 L,D-transpeptidase family protein [Micavibrio sp.]HPQ50843.1 L,D-transpeptidase family protein [Alphaproteobacteria bacterium]HRK96988.1 L,D-transpeptidase family protein [Alphaproteobacteria bacterium]